MTLLLLYSKNAILVLGEDKGYNITTERMPYPLAEEEKVLSSTVPTEYNTPTHPLSDFVRATLYVDRTQCIAICNKNIDESLTTAHRLLVQYELLLHD